MKVLLSVLVAVFVLGTCSVASAGDVTSKVDVTVWGRAKFDLHYDTADINGNTDFATRVTNSDPDDYDAELNFNGRDTRFGFKGSLVDGDMVCGAVGELDFYGTNAGNNLIPRMRLGYVFMKNGNLSMRFGQDWVPVAQQNPATIDFGILSYGGNLWWRVPQITARYKMEGGLELLGSLMKHRIRSDADHEEVSPKPASWTARVCWRSAVVSARSHSMLMRRRKMMGKLSTIPVIWPLSSSHCPLPRNSWSRVKSTPARVLVKNSCTMASSMVWILMMLPKKRQFRP